jgi:hypothetical protein
MEAMRCEFESALDYHVAVFKRAARLELARLFTRAEEERASCLADVVAKREAFDQEMEVTPNLPPLPPHLHAFLLPRPPLSPTLSRAWAGSVVVDAMVSSCLALRPCVVRMPIRAAGWSST